MKIPVYQPEAQLQPLQRGPQATGDTFGAQVGEAQQQLGRTIASVAESLGSNLQSALDENAKTDATAKLMDFEARQSTAATKMILETDPAQAGDLPGRYQQQFSQDAQSLVQSVSPRMQGMVQQHIASFGMRANVHINNEALKSAYQYGQDQITKSASVQADRLMQNPDDFDAATMRFQQLTDSTRLPPWMKKQAFEQGYVSMVEGAYQGKLDAAMKANDKEGVLAASQWRMNALRSLPQFGAPPPPNKPMTLLPADRDAAIRTIYGEAGDQGPDGQIAVANVIRNRVASGRWGGNVTSVVQAPGQFEPWQNDGSRQRMESLKPTDPQYQKIGALVDAAFSGEAPDNTNGATHFVAPKAQADLGRKQPDWAGGQKLASIGGHDFYAPEGQVKQPGQPDIGHVPVNASPIKIASALIGADEVGARQTLSEFIGKVGGAKVDPATTAWCAAFVNGVLSHAGIKGTDSLAARSFLNFGVPTDKPEQGDIVVLSRGSDPTKGHVGFYVGEGADGKIKILGGNQGNAVSVAEFPKDRVIGYRRADGSEPGKWDVQSGGAAGTMVPSKWETLVRQGDQRARETIHLIDQQNAKEREDVKQLIDSDLLSIQDTGKPLKELTPDRVRSAFGDQYANRWLENRSAARDYRSNMAGIENVTDENEALTRIGNLAPKGGESNFKYREDLYTTALKQWKTIQDSREKQRKELADGLMKEGFSRADKGTLTAPFVEGMRPYLSAEQYHTMIKSLKEDKATDTPAALQELVPKVDEMEPPDFQKRAGELLDQGNISTGTYKSLILQNLQKRKDDQPASPYKSGREYVKQALASSPVADPTMHAIGAQAQVNALTEFDNWSQANPNADRKTVMDMASDIARRYQPIQFNNIKLTLGVSHYFGNKQRDQVTLDDVTSAEDRLAGDIQANPPLVSPAQAAFEARLLNNWRTVLEDEARRAATKAGNGKRP